MGEGIGEKPYGCSLIIEFPQDPQKPDCYFFPLYICIISVMKYSLPETIFTTGSYVRPPPS